jgi:hypothetical protein
MRGLFKIASGIVGGGVAVFGGVSAIGDETERDANGAIVESGGVGVLELHIGDCVQLPDAVEVASVEGVPCADYHDAQVYTQFPLAGSSYPGASTAEQQAGQGCYERWSAALGTTYEDDFDRDFTTLYPTPGSWDAGDRTVSCLVVAIDGLPVTGSAL